MTAAAPSPAMPRLNGLERAAILLLGMPAEQMGKVMELLSEDEIRAISRTMSRLGKVDAAVVDAVCHDFSAALGGGSLIVGTDKTTETLLRNALIGRDELIDSIMQEVRGPSTSTSWDRVATVEPKTMADYLAKEHPQVAAIVLAQLFPDYAAQILAFLPADTASDIMVRFLELGGVNRDILEDIERVLCNDLGMSMSQDSGRKKKKNPHGYMADLIGRVDGDTEARLLGSLETFSPDHAALVRKNMFTFADLLKISDASIQALLQECDKSRLAMGLKLSDEPTRQVFFRNMSERQAKLFSEELEAGGSPKKSEVEAAQKEILLLAKALAAAGLISLEPEEAPEAVEAAA